MQKIKVSEIELDRDMQPRVEIDSDAVSQYAEDMKNGDTFPPVEIIFDGIKYYLVSGWHRVYAAKVAKQQTIDAIIKEGSREDAVWQACGTNAEHDKVGIRRSNADKQRAVKKALSYWHIIYDGRQMNYSEIARHCGVSKTMVSAWGHILGYSENGRNRQSLPIAPDFTEDPTPEREENFYEWLLEDSAGDIDLDVKSEIEIVNQELKGETFRSKFNRTNDNVEWAWWSWNPVTGCLHDCVYCYARDIANRFYPQKFEPTFYPERLNAPQNTDPVLSHIGGQNVFVCSMADLFGKWVPGEWIDAVLQAIQDSPQWTFLLLTKFPVRMADFTYPPNVWLGTTVDYQWRIERAEKAFRKIKASGFDGICWLSCEPMMERLTFVSLDMFDWIVMGGASRSSQTPEYAPPFDDIVCLHNQARAYDLPIYQKTNLMPGISTVQRLREYPKKIGGPKCQS